MPRVVERLNCVNLPFVIFGLTIPIEAHLKISIGYDTEEQVQIIASNANLWIEHVEGLSLPVCAAKLHWTRIGDGPTKHLYSKSQIIARMIFAGLEMQNLINGKPARSEQNSMRVVGIWM